MPQFQTVSGASGFDFTRFDGISHRRRITEVNGGGVGIIDLDGDGLDDIFMPNGSRLPVRTSDRETPGQIFRNLGKMTFEEISQQAGVHQFGFGCGCAVGDWDNDGFADLFVTMFGTNQVWKNHGDGTFTDVSAAFAFDQSAWSTSAALADLNGDGCLDLFVVNYLNEAADQPRLCPNPASPTGYEGCSPALFEGVPDQLVLSNRTWQPGRLGDQSTLQAASGKGLGVVIVDLDDDRQTDIYVANDGEANFLYSLQNSEQRAVRLRDVAFEANVAFNESGFAQAGMGVTAADYDRSGTIDLFLTHFYGDTNTLYSNRGQLQFDDVTRRSRLGPPSRSTLGFGTVFTDFNSDGWPDLIVANGHVDDREWIDGGQPYRMPPQCFLNRRDSTFRDVSESAGAYFNKRWLGRGLAVADLDRDGRPDIVISHQLDPSVILRNTTEVTERSSHVRFIGRQSNRDAIGTGLAIESTEPVLRKWVIGGGSFQSASALEITVPRGDGANVTAVVQWPDGSNNRLVLKESAHYATVQGRDGCYRLPKPR